MLSLTRLLVNDVCNGSNHSYLMKNMGGNHFFVVLKPNQADISDVDLTENDNIF
jgi:hypothetical protein